MTTIDTNDRTLEKTALFVALASVLQIAESFLPHPVPGMRLGLANAVTLVALVTLGARPAIETALLRTVVSSLVMGTFLSPAFAISFAAALASVLVMIGMCRFAMLTHGRYVGLVGVSLAGAVVHNLTQLAVAYGLVIRHPGVFLLLPWLGIGAVATGWITGWIAIHVTRRLKEPQSVARHEGFATRFQVGPAAGGSPFSSPYLDTGSRLHSLPAIVKVLILILLSIVVLALKSLSGLGLLALLLLLAASRARLPFGFMSGVLRRQLVLLVVAFATPALFVREGCIVAAAGPLALTRDGLAMGTLFAARLALLMFGASLVARTTRPEDLARALGALLSPFDRFGMNSERVAAILVASWLALPVLWNHALGLLRAKKTAKNDRRQTMRDAVDVVASLYHQADGRKLDGPEWERQETGP